MKSSETSKPPRAERVVRRNGKEYRYAAYVAKPKNAAPKTGTLSALTAAWQRSPDWNALGDKARRSHTHYLRPLHKLMSKQAGEIERSHIVRIRDLIAEGGYDGEQGPSPAAANQFLNTACRLFNWGIEAGMAKANPAGGIKRLKTGHLPQWTEEVYELAIANLPEHMRRAVLLAVHTGQRRGDLIRMTWSQYDGQTIRVKQRKTGAELVIPVHPELKDELDYWKRHPICNTAPHGERVIAMQTLILTNSRGKAWFKPNTTTEGDHDSEISVMFKHHLQKIVGIPLGFNAHGLRKLAAARLAESGCTIHEIGAITGHRALSMVELYTRGANQKTNAEAAMAKLTSAQRRTKRGDAH